MKKSLTVLVCLILLFQTVPFVSAYTYNADLYTIDIPEGFDMAGENEFIADDDSNFSVSFTDNKDEKLCIADLNEKEMKEYTDTIVSETETAFKNAGIYGEITVVSCEKVKHSSGKTALVTVLRTAVTQENNKIVRMQKIYEFTGVNNKYTFIYTAKEENQINDFDSAFDSIVINEEQIQSVGDKVTTAAIAGGVMLLICIGIIRFIRTPMKKKQ